MDGGDWGLLILAGLAWRLFNVWNDTRIRFRCNGRTSHGWPWCREPVARPGDRCQTHVSRRRRSLGP